MAMDTVQRLATLIGTRIGGTVSECIRHTRQGTKKWLPNRCGVMAVKKFDTFYFPFLILRGMSAVWDAKGNRLPVTILQVSRAQVVSVKTLPKHGYWAVQVGIGLRKPKNVSKAMLGHFAAAQVAPKANVGEFRVQDESGLLPVGEYSDNRACLIVC